MPKAPLFLASRLVTIVSRASMMVVPLPLPVPPVAFRIRFVALTLLAATLLSVMAPPLTRTLAVPPLPVCKRPRAALPVPVVVFTLTLIALAVALVVWTLVPLACVRPSVPLPSWLAAIVTVLAPAFTLPFRVMPFCVRTTSGNVPPLPVSVATAWAEKESAPGLAPPVATVRLPARVAAAPRLTAP